nr:winged helix-turn-helix domain-containing protein [uncultured Sphingomonas sp.]
MPDHANSPARIAVGEYIVDRNDERLIGPSGPVKLGNKAFRVLLALVDQEGQLLTKDALFSTVWDGTIVSESALTSTIKELRRALGDGSKTPSYIESVYGRGYRLIAEVSEAPESLKISSDFVNQKTIEESRPPVIVVSGFNDDAVKDLLPYAGPALREEVLSGLSRFREIQLISDVHFDEHRPGASTTDRAYQLTGTLLPERDSAKVIARLRRLADGRVLWVESMSLAKDGLIEGVDRIVRKIIGAVLPVVDQDVFQSLNVSGSLYDRYVQAKHISLNPANYLDARKASSTLEAIIRENPNFALPYAPLVRLYNTDYFFTGFGTSTSESRANALALAKKQLTIDPGEVHAYTALAFCNLYNGNWAHALANAEQALDRNPFNALRLNEVAAIVTYLGDFDRAETLLNRSAELQPYQADYNLEDVGRLHMLRGDHQTAAEFFMLMMSRQVWSHLYEAINAIELGHADAPADFAAWKQRIVDGWKGNSIPTNDRILEFIRYHHPFKGSAGDKLFAMAESALAATNS